MADGNRSAKGKEVVDDDDPASYWTVGGGAPSAAEPVVNPYDGGYFSYGAAGGSWIGGSGSYGVPGGAAGAVGWDGSAAPSGGTSGSNFGSDGAANNANYGGSRAVGRRGGGNGMGFLPENGGGAFFPPTHGMGMDPRMYAQAPQYHAAPGYYSPNVNGGASSFPSPFTGAAGAPGPGPQHAGPGYWPAGNGGGGSAAAAFPSPFTGGADHELYAYRGGNANGGGGGSTTFPYAVQYHAPPHGGGQQRSRSPLSRYREQLNTLIESSLRSLSFGDRGESLLARGRRHLSDLVGHHGHQQEPPLPQQQLNAGGTGDLPQRAPSPADPYAGRRLEDVRGAMGGVARNIPGCQFLVRMVDEGGAAAAQLVFEEVAGEILRLMVDAVAHELVEKLVEYWTDEEVPRVLQMLAASPDQVLAVARDHAGSNILQTLVGRMAGNPGHAELFTSTLARLGEHGVTSLIEHPDGSRLILKCLDTFSAYQNRFITAVVSSSFFLHRLCRDKHGSNVVNRCIDKAAGDEELLSSLAAAVCRDGFALAEDGYGNFVVQHVMSAVPEARGYLHELFRGRFVSLSRQAASSHVVQHCLELFSPEQADEIVRELLGCHRWDCTFQQLITDPYANYVLQTAMRRRGVTY
ncbi:unnamed protein product [Urochloa decumbens]|uniref:PUM-HD domain-containing protein n=1 Tax=Urochloa decumbens TaxID=240449 RepID=A0ABC8VAW3_9POAL